MIVGLAMGTTVSIARAVGAGEGRRTSAIVGSTITLFMVVALAAMALLLVCVNPIVTLMSTPEAAVAGTRQYLTICFVGIPFITAYNIISSIFRGLGDSKSPMYFIAAACGANIALDYLFIGALGLGAALGTVLSRAASCIFTLLFLFGRRTRIRITFGGYSWRIMRRVMIFGLSPFLIAALDSVILIVFNSVLQRYGGPQNGDTYVACATIVQSYMQIITLPLGGITGGTQPVLSFNYGAKRIDRIKSGFRNILTLCIPVSYTHLDVYKRQGP